MDLEGQPGWRVQPDESARQIARESCAVLFRDRLGAAASCAVVSVDRLNVRKGGCEPMRAVPVVGSYRNRILPYIVHVSMRQATFAAYRRRVVPTAGGCVLEIGVGSGLNARVI
jgi:hypothetical protein